VTSGPTRTEWILAGALAVWVLLLFLPTIRYDFVEWDDPLFVTNNPLIQGLSAENLRGMFSQYVSGNYIPLTLLSFAINYEMAGLQPWIFHLTNVLLHVLNVLLVVYFLHRLTGSFRIALIAAAFFGLHPLRVESVAWVTERKDVLFAFFYLTSLTVWLRFRDTGKVRDWGVALGLFLCAGLAKQQAVSLPVILLIGDWYTRRINRRSWVAVLPFFVLAAGFAAIAVYGQWSEESLKAGAMYSPLHRVLLASHSLGFYIIKQVWPHPLSVVYEFPVDVIAHSAFSPLRTMAMAGIFLWMARRNRLALFGGAFFLITLLPMLNLFPAGVQVVADRFSYLPALGFGLLLALLWQWTVTRARKTGWHLPIHLGGLLLLLVLAGVTWQRNKVWENSYTLWTHTLKVMPESYTAMMNLGVWHLNANDTAAAMALAERLTRLHPHLMDGYLLRGLAHHRMGQHEQAVADFTRAINHMPEESQLLTYRAQVFMDQEKPRQALADIETALSLAPARADAWHMKGLAHALLEEYEQAVAAFTTALELVPGQPDALLNRGRAQAMVGTLEGAAADYDQLLRLHPEHLQGRYQRMLLQIERNNLPGARQDARVLQSMNVYIPEDLAIRMHLQ
jgi:protein O-mannosyl-transferase